MEKKKYKTVIFSRYAFSVKVVPGHSFFESNRNIEKTKEAISYKRPQRKGPSQMYVAI